MRDSLSREQIIDLLENVLDTKVVESSKAKDNIQFCCTVHGESNPSAGIHVEKQVFHCFSCHATGSISWLLFQSSDRFKSVYEAEKFLEERYEIDFSQIDSFATKELKRYEDFNTETEKEERFELPIYKIAPYKSGKETYEYFFDRGFTKETVKEFKIGRDLVSKTVTIPVFWEDKKLAGIIGRYIDPNRPKNSRYKIYEFPKGSLTFPLDKLEVINDTIILVEGILDAIWLYQLGFKNVQSILGNGISKKQADIIKSKCRKIICMYDNDKGGETALDITENILKNSGIIIYKVKYPEGRNDPQECNKEEIQYMIDNSSGILNKKIKRL